MVISERILKKNFRTVFPDESKRLEACKTQEEVGQVHKEIIAECKKKLTQGLKTLGIHHSEEEVHSMFELPTENCVITLSNEAFTNLTTAVGESIKEQLMKIIDGLQKLKGMTNDNPAAVTAQLLKSGILSVGKIASSEAGKKLIAGVVESAAAEAGVAAATVSAVCAIVTACVVAIVIPILYFMNKPAGCFCLLINELDAPLEFVTDYCVHGKSTMMTAPIPEVVHSPNYDTHAFAGFIVSQKKENALYGSQYGFVMRYKGEDLAFGMECPLTSLYSYNNCYCEFTSDAKAVAEKTDKEDRLSWQASKENLRLSIRCHSDSGSHGVYVARAYKT